MSDLSGADFSDLHLPFGLDTAGRMVAVSEVAQGLACNCLCAECRRPLVAHKGPIRVHHFQHAPGPSGAVAGCGGGLETALHRMAKQILANAAAVRVPRLLANYRDFTDVLAPSRFVAISSAREEARIVADTDRYSAIVPDVLADTADGQLAIEVYVTHHCTPDKLAEFQRRALPAIEIDLSDFRPANLAAIDSYVLSDAPRTWLFHPDQGPAIARLTATIKALAAAKQAAERASREAEEAEARRQEQIRAELKQRWDAEAKLRAEQNRAAKAEADRAWQEAAEERKAKQREAAEQYAKVAAERAERDRAARETAEIERRRARQKPLDAISAWAETYYPERQSPPPPEIETIFLTADLVSLFSRTTTRRAHLALVDQPAIRNCLASPGVLAAVYASWDRNGW